MREVGKLGLVCASARLGVAAPVIGAEHLGKKGVGEGVGSNCEDWGFAGGVGGALGVLRRSGAGECVVVWLVSRGGCWDSEHVRLRYLLTTTRGMSSASSCAEAMHAELMYCSLLCRLAVSCDERAAVLYWCSATAMQTVL